MNANERELVLKGKFLARVAPSQNSYHPHACPFAFIGG